MESTFLPNARRPVSQRLSERSELSALPCAWKPRCSRQSCVCMSTCKGVNFSSVHALIYPLRIRVCARRDKLTSPYLSCLVAALRASGHPETVQRGFADARMRTPEFTRSHTSTVVCSQGEMMKVNSKPHSQLKTLETVCYSASLAIGL